MMSEKKMYSIWLANRCKAQARVVLTLDQRFEANKQKALTRNSATSNVNTASEKVLAPKVIRATEHLKTDNGNFNTYKAVKGYKWVKGYINSKTGKYVSSYIRRLPTKK